MKQHAQRSTIWELQSISRPEQKASTAAAQSVLVQLLHFSSTTRKLHATLLELAWTVLQSLISPASQNISP